MRLTDHQLVRAAFEGTLGESAFLDLQRRLGEEPELLALYREHALLHHSLCEEYEGRSQAGDAPPVPSRAPRWITGIITFVVLAALSLAAWKWFSPGKVTRLMAGCDFSADASANLDGRPAVDGSGFAPGSRLTVDRGWVRLSLPRQTVAVVQAPASIVYESDKTLRLESGRARFQIPQDVEALTVKAPSLVANAQTASFGVLAKPGTLDEVHVFEGEINLKAAIGASTDILKAKEAASVNGEGSIQRIESREQDFASLTPEVRLMLEDHFDSGTFETGRRPAVGASHWRLEKGAPKIVGNHLEGSEFEAYFYLPADALSVSRPVLLVTVETAETSAAPFHTPEWSGFSLYQEGYEVCFFGDSFGPEETWSLDVKRSLVPLKPAAYEEGPRTMTLRYDRRDGSVELHEGAEPGPHPLIRSKLLPGLNFDQIRIGAGPGAALGVKSVIVRAIEDSSKR